MKARTAARELALMALYQQQQQNGAMPEHHTLRDVLLESVRMLSRLAREQIETTGHEIASLQAYLQDHEWDHPDNANVSVDLPTKPVAIPDTQEMIAKLNALLAGLDNLQHAFTYAEIQALSQREDVQNYCLMLIRTVNTHKEAIDQRIDDAATDWRVDRLQKMDLTLLRLAVAELQAAKDVDVPTIVDETLELAKRFTTEESRKFIHGILGAVAEKLSTSEAPANA